MFALLFVPVWLGCSKAGLRTTRDAAVSGGSVGGAGGPGGTIGPGGPGGTSGASIPGGSLGAGGVTGGGGQPGTGGKSGAGGRTGGDAAGGMSGYGGAIPRAGAIGSDGGAGKGGATGSGGVIGTGASGGNGTGGSTGAGGRTCGPPTNGASGPLITFNDNGAWSAYQDERAVVDVKGRKLVVGSVAFGAPRSGNVEAVIYDLATGTAGAPAKLGNLPMDEHNAPAFVVRPDGKYVAVWAGHRTDCDTYYSIYDGSAWGAQMTFDWQPEGCPWNGELSQMVTYSNLWYMDGTLFDFVRSVDASPSALASRDDGATWSYFGRLTSTPSIGYLAGHYKFWGNHTDRIDFLGTEAHPRDNDNNLWHGYVQGGKLYNSTGTVVDDALAGDTAPASARNIDEFTEVFATGSTVGKVRLEHAWDYDIVRYDDGTVAILGQGRVTGTGANDPDKRSFYGRFDGTQWTLTYLAKMGSKLISSEEDYTGMGALHPDDPTTIFISTPYDPRDDMTKSSKHEIWRGTTCDNGATFQWTPVTENSTKSNIRPIVPKWDTQHTALLWLQGSFQSASYVASSVVGTVSGPGTATAP